MSKPRVLVADDHEVARMLVVQTLEAIGFEVTAVADGRSALESARMVRPDLMLLDVNMPELNGFDLLREVKASPDIQQIPVIMLTASGMSRDIAEALAMGAADYITKPFSPAELLARVRRVAKDMRRNVARSA
jgi:two-component system chemotaxis response regulator CheY